jgi:putative transposase
MSYHERRLPHWQPEAAALFITWRLYGSLPHVPGLLIGPSAGKAFVAMDRELAQAATGPHWLAEPGIARCVTEALQYGETNLCLYDLEAWVVMINHVHLLIQPKTGLSRINQSIKNHSARQANLILKRTGEPFWQPESYDHWIRNETEFDKVADYIEANPVAAGLVQRAEDWIWSSAAGQEASATKAGQEAYPTGS